MSQSWTQEQLSAASNAMQRMGEMSYDEFCAELNKARVHPTIYTYFMRDRHMDAGTLPKGVISIVPWGSRPYMPAIGARCFGKVDFDRRLSDAELIVYGLIPA